MNLFDIVGLAWDNLRRQWWRNVLNIAGVFVGCLLLFITLAITRGVETGIHQFLDQNQLLRRIQFYVDFDPEVEVPEEVLQVTGQMSEDRRARIRKRLEQKWRFNNQSKVVAGVEFIHRLESLPGIVEVVPETYLGFQIKVQDQSMDGNSLGISTHDQDVQERVIFGTALQPDDQSGVLINEFTAYQMGWRDDAQLQRLVGQTVTMTCEISETQLNNALRFLSQSGEQPSLSDNLALIEAIRLLLDEMDATSLSDQQKQMIRERLQVDFDNQESTRELIASMTCQIRGVFRNTEDSNLSQILYSVITADQPDIYLNHTLSTRLYLQYPENEGFWSGMVEVEHYDDLSEVSQTMEDMGLMTISANWFVDQIDEQIVIARQIAAGLALAIFCIVAIGIANAMTISVLQRTREFGIMKALGAKDSGIVRLMLLEGGLTGFLGATLALAVSVGASLILTEVIRERWLDDLSETGTWSVFQFSPVEVLLVFAIAIVVTTLAAVLPARRAARLDPVEAMRR